MFRKSTRLLKTFKRHTYIVLSSRKFLKISYYKITVFKRSHVFPETRTQTSRKSFLGLDSKTPGFLDYTDRGGKRITNAKTDNEKTARIIATGISVFIVIIIYNFFLSYFFLRAINKD